MSSDCYHDGNFVFVTDEDKDWKVPIEDFSSKRRGKQKEDKGLPKRIRCVCMFVCVCIRACVFHVPNKILSE